MIILLHCVLLFVSLACCFTPQDQCPPADLCTTQPLNIKSASSTENNILYGQLGGSDASEPVIAVIIQEQQNAEDILWIATFDAKTNSYTFTYQSNLNYFLTYRYQTVNGLGVAIMSFNSSSSLPPAANVRWVLEGANFHCNSYAMRNAESGTYLQFDPGENFLVLASRAANTDTDQAWTFPGSSC